MLGVATLDEYLRRPVGQYLLGPTYVIWWLNARLNGILFWGRPVEAHIRIITTALAAESALGVAPHASIIDARQMAAVDLGAFNALSSYVHAQREPLSRVVTRQAVLRPGGLVGAAVAGFHAVVGSPYPTRVFSESTPALEWLGVAAEDATVLSELDDLRTREIGDSPIVTRLRLTLRRKPDATLQEAADSLAVSPRDLQRRLHEAQTRFKSEQMGCQIQVAKTLLLETDYELKRVAIEVGCSSPQHFSALFRDVVGETPSQWRARRRPDAYPSR